MKNTTLWGKILYLIVKHSILWYNITFLCYFEYICGIFVILCGIFVVFLLRVSRGVWEHVPLRIFFNGAIWGVLENILLKFCENKIGEIFIFYIKIIDNVLLRTLYLGVLEHTPQISCQLCNLVCFGEHYHKLFLKKIYINI